MKAGNQTLGSRLRIVLEPDIAIGPGKADILQGIKDTGSIAAAGRRMGMSYKRAWYLVESMNKCFAAPLVAASKGGRSGGGARLTELGETVLSCYRQMEALAGAAIEPEMKKLRRVLRDASKSR
jgi:molybdate transport system regulatory protein